MGYQSAYTRALLGKDTRAEGLKEYKEWEAANRKRAKEEARKKFMGTVLGIAGSAFGPIGGFIGSAIGTLGTDLLGDAEKSKVSSGKFDRYKSDTMNETLDDYDKAGNIDNVKNLAVKALTSFASAGGVEGLRETTENGGDFMEFATTFGSGDEQKMNLVDWMKMSSQDKLAAGEGGLNYFQYMTDKTGEGYAKGVLPEKHDIMGNGISRTLEGKDPTSLELLGKQEKLIDNLSLPNQKFELTDVNPFVPTPIGNTIEDLNTKLRGMVQ